MSRVRRAPATQSAARSAAMSTAASLIAAVLATACGAGELGPAGSRVTLRGRVSDTPWQHMMTSVPGKEPAYFDLDDERQTVVYWTLPPACRGDIEVTGTVIEAKGPGKRPGGGQSSEVVVERHVDVATARCVD
jgi:hypothetical protein